MTKLACAACPNVKPRGKSVEVERDSVSERGENCPIPLPKCRIIRHNSPMTPLLSGDCEESDRVKRKNSIYISLGLIR